MLIRIFTALFILLPVGFAPAATATPTDWAGPEVDGIWLRPAKHDAAAQPIWGHADGIQVGIAPLPGPRGLLRIYTPYLGHEPTRMINYIAFEPVVEGQRHRGFSELEPSDLDHVKGKRFWSADEADAWESRDPVRPDRGVVSRIDGVETLTVHIFSERFNNGAQVGVRMRFRADRPHEVALATIAGPDSAPLRHSVITATMGNYARLRSLFLRDGEKLATDLWPNFSGNRFAPHQRYGIDKMLATPKGAVLFVSAPNESDPANVEYSESTPPWWRYTGQIATQYWRAEDPHPDIQGLVNARYTFYLSDDPIPGGASFENFELLEPFREGAEFWFGVTPENPEAFIKAATQ